MYVAYSGNLGLSISHSTYLSPKPSRFVELLSDWLAWLELQLVLYLYGVMVVAIDYSGGFHIECSQPEINTGMVFWTSFCLHNCCSKC